MNLKVKSTVLPEFALVNSIGRAAHVVCHHVMRPGSRCSSMPRVGRQRVRGRVRIVTARMARMSIFILAALI